MAHAKRRAHAHAHDHGPAAPPPAVAVDAQDTLGNAHLSEQLDASSDHDGGVLAELGALQEGANPLGRVSDPAPVVEGEQRRTVLGVEIVGRGVSPTALDVCERIVTALVGSSPDVQARLEAASTRMVIVGRAEKMVDTPEFAPLKGTQTFDGRTWDDVRGSGGMVGPEGDWVLAVPEEGLVDTGSDAYGAGYSVGLHELAHTVHIKGLGEAHTERITELYAARKEAGGPWTESYGASNEQEYFAQCTNAFFGMNGGMGHNGAAWLEANDAEMYAFLVSLYGPPSGAEHA